ncbi:amidohydrolase-domain-containing protein [Cristinia sonorae]|uniref:Amidohydrolase-domain-containing protein n=1 Tax=Cristinia sonorae TaxID=1940300 RepID=A0A8K0XQJ0_9AGAR|nr:amidohydrolase-domain-containing protein [Cristinia sonorae]
MNTAYLARVTFGYPAIDNHAHPLLSAVNRNAIPFEGLISEANPGQGLLEDAPNTLACFRATGQLSRLYRLSVEPTWEAVKAARGTVDYHQLCVRCMEPTRIQCILMDDGLGGVKELAEGYKWHDSYTYSPTKRIVRVEVLAESILLPIVETMIASGSIDSLTYATRFIELVEDAIQAAAADPEVVAFKSIACYRTGLDIAITTYTEEIERALMVIVLRYEMTRKLRLADKAVNDMIVLTTLRIAGRCGKPVQFHTGLGDNDITLKLASPSHMQSIIKAFPDTNFVLLHSSYPYTREAGYLTANYPNVYLDFGEVFPFLSAEGQRNVVRQVLELAPTNKILWSTDGHWWPESYYLGTVQAREVLYDVLSASVKAQEMTEAQAIGVVKRALFDNANKLYNLGLEPHIPSSAFEG